MRGPDSILQSRYRIVRQLAQGGMGTVYEAVDERLDATVALKECHFADEQLRKQFEREARLLAKLRHPAITRVIDHFHDADGQFLVMDYIAGDDLSEILRRKGGPLSSTDVLTWADQLLVALDYLHSQDPPVIHRDIKPQNLKLTTRNQIVLLDFGLAKGFAGQISRVTTSGSIFGYTPNYAPLEQIQGTGTDPRSDLYSLAATLYHLMTGAVPPDVLTRLTATTDGQADPLRLAHELNQKIPIKVGTVLQRAMSVGRNQRFGSAAEMRKALADANIASDSSDSEEAAPVTLSSTIVDRPPTTVEEQEPVTLVDSKAMPLTKRAKLNSTIAAPFVARSNPERPAALEEPEWEIPSTALFEQPMGKIDRFAAARKSALVFLAFVLFIVMVFIFEYFRR